MDAGEDDRLHGALSCGTTTSDAARGSAGTSQRKRAVAAAETVAASAVRRSALTGEDVAVARVADLPTIVPAVQGKVDMPLGKTFWSPRFGMLTDRFGVQWMVIVPQHDK